MSRLEHMTNEVLGFLRQLASPESLRQLPYRDYLLTPHWAQMKRIAHAASSRSLQPRCQLCGCDDERNMFHVHHNTYTRLGQEDLLDLVVLCHDCHKLFHDSKQLWETTPGLVRASLLQKADEARLEERAEPASATGGNRVPPKGAI